MKSSWATTCLKQNAKFCNIVGCNEKLVFTKGVWACPKHDLEVKV